MGNLVTQASTDVINFGTGDLQASMQMADLVSRSNFVPKDYQGSPGNVLVAVQMGSELGLKPMQSLQNIAVINGRPCVWGDSLMGLVLGNPVCEWVQEDFDDDNMIATCRAKRKGNEKEFKATFSFHDAKVAGLANKKGPWLQYPKRMLALRARAFCLRNAFADVLGGLNVAEEVQDYPDDAPTTLNNAKDVLGGSDNQNQPVQGIESEVISTQQESLVPDHVANVPTQTEEDIPPAEEEEVIDVKKLPKKVKALGDLIGKSTSIKELNSHTEALANAPEKYKNFLREMFKQQILNIKEASNAEGSK